ncbi:putative uncharacterized protein DDB_G0277255 isoform X2 [Condylostylus longicornis]|uniref:putative uncharacterized protein DDB_G0277255 isoform X2 n=1 Tax=Condylostylus longicornis TaxID=2530218 RepID=UPI00244DEF12|nr:putative uncharacterized protein DDB_G0277255 isoform X2 [Condylostylus longicornis]
METITACFCCRKKIHKRNEFQGLEGMVKLKNPEDNNLIEPNNTEVENVNSTLVVQVIETSSTTTSNGDAESKRASSVPQRSLPDIPITEPSGQNDNYSDLYATVADKVEGKPSPPSLKKQTSISQHSSISQADVNSPYATVKNPTHGYDKVRKSNEEHPYAQLNAPSTSRNTIISNKENPYENTDETEDTSLPPININQNISDSSLTESENSPQEVIPAAAAMLGMISASQELPYMTPPIVPQPNFSGDSQDSSKGYTSISVREPLANIIAQTKQQQRLSSKQRTDSHYATVSDDSDEMYAAIEDPNNVGDIYNSGSETYAQIQPTNQLVTVQINQSYHQGNLISNSNQTICISTVMAGTSRRSGLDMEHVSLSSQPSTALHSNASTIHATDQTPAPPTVDSLFAMHSRQASSSSNVSYIGNIGSPKPEKRQANSPLPPTPKNGNSFSNLSNQSGRNSAVVEESPPKDIDGMYAKVMKKGKYPNSPSQNNSPVLGRRHINNVVEKISDLKRSNSFKQIENSRPRSDSYDKTNGNNLNIVENRKSEGCSVVRSLFTETTGETEKAGIIIVEPGYESLPDTSSLNTNDPGYETLLKNPLLSVANNEKNSKPNSDYDPNYEVLQPFNTNKIYTNTSGDDGYAKVLEKRPAIIDDMRQVICSNSSNDNEDDDILAGYSKVKERKSDDDTIAGYSKVKDKDDDDVLAGYSKVKERKVDKDDDDISAGYCKVKDRNEIEDDDILAGYSKVKERKPNVEDDENMPGYSSIKEISNKKIDLKDHGYASISEAKQSNDPISSKNYNNNNNNNNIKISNTYNNNNNNNNNEYKLTDSLSKYLINDNNINTDIKCSSDIYSTIDQNDGARYNEIKNNDEEHKYSTIGTKKNLSNKNNLYMEQKEQIQMERDIPPPLPPVGTRSPELLTNKKLENSNNYKKKENPYEKVKDVSDINLTNDKDITKTTNVQENGSVLVVDDYFHV